jgi:hypothetical protein
MLNSYSLMISFRRKSDVFLHICTCGYVTVVGSFCISRVGRFSLSGVQVGHFLAGIRIAHIYLSLFFFQGGCVLPSILSSHGNILT